jgi:uncharacterized membrane protein YidH (DUF202 family)
MDVEIAASGSESESVAISEVQLLLAEERTSLALMRTGIAVLALPLSVFSLLIATSKYYDAPNVLHLLIPLGVLCLALLAFGIYLVFHALTRIRRITRLIHRIKLEHSTISEYLDPE